MVFLKFTDFYFPGVSCWLWVGFFSPDQASISVGSLTWTELLSISSRSGITFSNVNRKWPVISRKFPQILLLVIWQNLLPKTTFQITGCIKRSGGCKNCYCTEREIIWNKKQYLRSQGCPQGLIYIIYKNTR